ncbi:MAG: YncE family protein [Chloroflexi bacterium]|nr:YncE family protein [Chloroflexota bacterium]
MLKLTGSIELPEHTQPGGFDHADIHPASNRLYVAHTCNNAIDVIDCTAGRYSHSIPGLTGVAGALISGGRVFTSNRGENTVGIFPVHNENQMTRVPVGVRPNGLAFDPARNLLLAANVGNPEILNSFTVSMVNVQRAELLHSIPVPGRTRWAIFDPQTDSFYVNIADPAVIVAVSAQNPGQISHSFPIPAAGPHGLDLDAANRRLFCACDAGRLVTVGLPDGEIQSEGLLSGIPDVIFFHPNLQRLYVAVGDPGVIDVFDTKNMTHIESIETGKGAHTFALDKAHNTLYVFLPQNHSAAVYIDD